jgi:cytochrome P450 family 138
MAVVDPARASREPEPGPPASPLPPPGAGLPRALSAALFLLAPQPTLRLLRRRHGDVFSVWTPVFGEVAVVASPELVKRVFQASPEVLSFGETSPLGEILGQGSLFAMDDARHLRERRLILPAFHGERMRGYENVIEEEARREMAVWPEGEEFPTMPSFMRITLAAILRTVFGAQGEDASELASVLPPLVTIGSRLALLRPLRRDLGPRSPGGRFRRLRARYDAIVERLIDAGRADPDLESREDVMAMLMRANYDDGERMSRAAIADELLTLLAAGHETTATTLAWGVERLRRHPDVLLRLAEEARTGEGRELRVATIHELQRSRPVIPATSRNARVDFPLGGWTIPRGRQIIVSASLIHSDRRFFPDPERFDPGRFLAREVGGVGGAANYTWIPFGGGTRRCPGAAFAHMEMDIVLRTLLREFTLQPTRRRGERLRDRGVANAPARGGLAVVHRRAAG